MIDSVSSYVAFSGWMYETQCRVEMIFLEERSFILRRSCILELYHCIIIFIWFISLVVSIALVNKIG